MIDSTCAIEIALNDTSNDLADWKVVDVTVLRCEKVGDHWSVDVRRVYSHGDCVIFPCEISSDGSTNSYSLDFFDLPPQFQHLDNFDKEED